MSDQHKGIAGRVVKFIKSLDRDMRHALVVITFFYSGLSILVGVMNTVDGRSAGLTGCVYTSLGSFNPVYVLTCELFRKRFEVGK